MLLARKEAFRPTRLQEIVLGHMGYAAYKLWNVGNYEKRNYKELGMETFPNWYDQKKRLKENFFYKNLPSQSAQDVLGQLHEAWKSFFKLKKTGGIENPKPPRFRREKMAVTFLKDAIVQKDGQIRLSIPKQLKTYLKSQGVDATYLYLKTKRFSDIHIKELQIKFGEKNFQMIAVYEYEEPDVSVDNGHYLSIDLGINCTFSCYDSLGESFLLSGLLNITHYFDKEIAKYQFISDSQQATLGVKYPKKSKRIRSLHEKKRNKVNDFIHKSTRYLADYCKEHDVSTVVIGDLKGIRKDANLGRLNQQLHAFPFVKIKQKLEYKLKLYGITLISQKENYTSQCSPLVKKVCKETAVKSNRISRGLYRDGNMIFHADCVGAYNILRLFQQSHGKEITKPIGLSSPIKVSV